MPKKVKVYSTQTCPYCHMVKDYLKQNAVAFDDIDVSASKESAQEMVNKSGQMGVPVIDIEGEIIVGFNRPKLAKALNLK